MDTLRKLQAAWKPKHLEHLLGCLQYNTAYFEDHFVYQGINDDGIVIDGKIYTQADIIKILAEYYDDDNNIYQTNLGDTIYLFFTDLVEEDVDILSEIERRVV